MDTTQLEAQRRHGSAALGGPLTPGLHPGLVVVDLVVGFTDPSSPAGANLDQVVATARRVIDRARDCHVPVWFTTISYSGEHHRMRTWLEKMPALEVLRDGSPAVEVDPRLGRRDDEPIIVKQAASAFFGTDLDVRVRSAECDHLLIIGATTSGCVRATAVDACSHDLPAFVVRDAVGDRAAEPHLNALLDMHAKYADVVDTERALALLASGTATARGQDCSSNGQNTPTLTSRRRN